MNPRTPAERFAIAFGIALIVIGAISLLGEGGLFAWSLTSLVHGLASIVWPLTLVLAGVALLVARSRSDEGHAQTAPNTSRRVVRSRGDRVATGLLGGVAAWLGAPSGLVRAAFVILTLVAGLTWGVLVYVVGSLLVPEAPAATHAATVQ